MNKLMINRRAGKSGYTVVEILVSSGVLLILLIMAFAFWSNVSAGSKIQQDQIDSRQNIRNAINFLQRDIRAGAYVFANRNVTVGGRQYSVPTVEGTGRELLFAYPENNDLGEVTYTVLGYYLQKKTRVEGGQEYPLDEANPDAYHLMRFEAVGIKPQTADAPESIDLEAITAGNTRSVADYIDGDNFEIYIGSNTEYIDITLGAKRRTVSSKRYETSIYPITINLRNKKL